MLSDILDLDLWLAVDIAEGQETLFLMHGKPKKISYDEDRDIVFDPIMDDFWTYGKMLSPKFLSLKGGDLYQLGILTKRDVKNARTFWITSIGYRKYLITNSYIAKVTEESEQSSEEKGFISYKPNPKTVIFVDKSGCEQRLYSKKSIHCANCEKVNICKKIDEKSHILKYQKFYMYFIKDGEKVFL